MDDDHTKILIQKRAMIKGSITRFKSFLDKVTNETAVSQLQERMDKIRISWNKFEEIQTELEILTNQNAEQLKEREQFEENYFDSIGRGQEILKELTMPSSASLPPSSQSSPAVFETAPRVKLPTIELPSFSGKYENWIGFYDTFKALIHDNISIAPVQKLYYLRSCLKDEAAQTIHSLKTSSENYAVAWLLLRERYDNRRAIIQSHIRQLFEYTTLNKESANGLRLLLDNALKHIRALKVLDEPTDSWSSLLIHIITTKLDRNTRREWEHSITGTAMPSIEELWIFLRNRCHALENINSENTTTERKIIRSAACNTHSALTSNKTSGYVGNNSRSICSCCKGDHNIQTCEKFRTLGLQEKTEVVKRAGLCFNCLRKYHLVSACNSAHCRKCGRKHHSLLHPTQEKQHANDDAKIEKSENQKLASLQAVTTSQVLLSTASAQIMDKSGKFHRCKLLLDSGSQTNFITEKLAARLKLNKSRIDVPITGFNEALTHISSAVSTTIQSTDKRFIRDLSFLVISRITNILPSQQIDRKNLEIPKNIVLADPEFDKPSEIDILIGAELFYTLLSIGQIKLKAHEAILQKTKLGWIISGRIPMKENHHTMCHLVANTVERQIEKFWEIEELPAVKHLSKEESACEEHFNRYTTRDITGRYVVRLPFNEKRNTLQKSRELAEKRYYNLERKLAQNYDLKASYVQFMQEYERLGHMTEILEEDHTQKDYFMPHHAVIKGTSLTTKTRVVFDASAKTSSGVSLNDTLMIGPTVQEDIISIISRFRRHEFVLTADIEKMYRQILMHPQDSQYQKIIWREKQDEPIKIFRLNTITYGTASASFLATRVLLQLARDEADNYPVAAEVLKNDFYVDDLLTGTNNFQHALELRNQLIRLLRSGGFNLRQWSSNDQRLLKELPIQDPDAHICLDNSTPQKTLGIHWNPKLDTILYIIQLKDVKARTTKRQILSQIASLFDPLGLLGPVIVKAKLVMQKLWQEKVEWDESISQELATEWHMYRNQLNLLNNFSVPRKIAIANATDIQLHGFCDASEVAYGACIYLRSQYEEQVHVRLVCSKTRVAPLQKTSLPKLELCSAMLLAKLYKTTTDALKMKFNTVNLWTDSMIVMHWINTSPHKLKTFVANRVAKIQILTHTEEWRHVNSKSNPADHASRGQFPIEFIANTHWLNGPSWLQHAENSWPITRWQSIEVPEKRAIVAMTNAMENNNSMLNRFSCLNRMKRVIAYCKRFAHNARNKVKKIGFIKIDELADAMFSIIQMILHIEFSKEINCLKKGKELSKNSKLLSLNPFIDVKNILRVGGRLRNAEIDYAAKHPILLPRKNHVTDLIVRDAHIRTMHAGAQSTLYHIRQKFWIIDGRNYVKGVIRKCVRCFRAKPSIPEYEMGDLPRNRVVFSRAFEITGIDFCGPFFIKEKKYRNRGKVKTYVAVFVCFGSKAVHLEVISDLSTETFIGGLRRFIARRGLPKKIYTDNATNFVGAKNELQELQSVLESQKHKQHVNNFVTKQGIQWSFIPPRSPHFGGLWEAAVKAFKHHFKRTVGAQLLTFEEMNTLVIEIEGILNSRPLSSLSSDPNDLIALCPNHFLLGVSLSYLPEHDVTQTPSNRLTSWRHIQKMRQHFWQRWNKEYINELIQRSKWLKNCKPIEVGTLVILKEENVPSLQWVLGRVIELHPGEDGVTRVVTVKTVNGNFKRSVKKIATLPIDTNEKGQ